MKKILFILVLCAFPMSTMAQTVITGFVVEDEVQAAGGIFDDSAFEPGLMALDLRGATPVVLFIENNHTTGANITTLYSYRIDLDDSADAVTLEITGEDETDTGDVQTALATTGNVFFRQGGGCISGSDVYLFCADKGTSTAEYLVDGDSDILIQVDIDTNSVTIVSSSDGAMSSAVISNNVFVELDETAGAAEDGIGMIDVSGSLPGGYTTVVTEAALEVAAGISAGSGVDIHGIASTSGGMLLVLLEGDQGVEPPRVLEVSDPAGSPSLSTKVTSSVLNGSSLGTLAPVGIDVTASDQIVVHSADDGGTGPPLTNEGFLHISPDGLTVENVVSWTDIINNGTDLGSGADTSRNFDSDEVNAYDDGDDLVILAVTQDNEEYIALVRLTGVLDVQDWEQY